MKVKWLTKALRNLEDELAFIAEDDPAMGSLVAQRIHDAVELLPTHPALGRPGRIHGTRELIVPDTRYILPYRVKPRLQQIEILRVFHASRRLPQQW